MSTFPSVVFMGTPEFAAIILKELLNTFNVLAVVAQPDKPVGRGLKLTKPPVAQIALEHSKKLFQPQSAKDPSFIKELKALQPDFLIVAAYGKLLPQEVLDLPKIDCVNVHASLLPLYRGAAPIQYALLNGEAQTGISLMSMTLKLDAGDVYTTKSLPILNDDTDLSLTTKLAHLGAEVLVSSLNLIIQKKLVAMPQNDAKATYAPKITKALGELNWQKPAQALQNQVRALATWPGVQTQVLNQRIKIFLAEVLPVVSKSPPGTVTHLASQGITVATTDFEWLIKECQLEGKKRLKAIDVAHGLRLKVGDTFI